MAAIASIGSYVTDAHYFLTLGGAWTHTGDGSVRDVRAWAGRGWCRVEQLSNEEEGLSHRRQLTRAVIADDRTEGKGRKGRPPPYRRRADDRPIEGDERISSKVHCTLHLTHVEGDAPARRRSATISPGRAAGTTGNEDNLLSHSKRLQDGGGLGRRPLRG